MDREYNGEMVRLQHIWCLMLTSDRNVQQYCMIILQRIKTQGFFKVVKTQELSNTIDGNMSSKPTHMAYAVF